jgi:hypothetical protein
MAQRYRLGSWRRMLNQIVRASLRVGLSPPHTYLLTVHGRKSGALYSTPVRLIEQDGKRWLVAPYGEVAWVRNARGAAGSARSRFANRDRGDPRSRPQRGRSGAASVPCSSAYRATILRCETRFGSARFCRRSAAPSGISNRIKLILQGEVRVVWSPCRASER